MKKKKDEKKDAEQQLASKEKQYDETLKDNESLNALRKAGDKAEEAKHKIKKLKTADEKKSTEEKKSPE